MRQYAFKAEDAILPRLVARRQRLGLTGPGRVLFILLVLACALAGLRGCHPFLAVNAPVETDVLVVEGWMPDYALAAALKRFRARNDRLLVVTGGPLIKGAPLSEYGTYAAMNVATLRGMGVSEERMAGVPGPDVQRDRTYATALAVRAWLARERPSTRAVNVYSLGAHARRSRLLYAKALGKDFDVGVIAGTDKSYDAATWWRSSDGVRAVMSETIAYVYARFFFRPPKDGGTRHPKHSETSQHHPTAVRSERNGAIP
jgi:hypothetical protein